MSRVIDQRTGDVLDRNAVLNYGGELFMEWDSSGGRIINEANWRANRKSHSPMDEIWFRLVFVNTADTRNEYDVHVAMSRADANSSFYGRVEYGVKHFFKNIGHNVKLVEGRPEDTMNNEEIPGQEEHIGYLTYVGDGFVRNLIEQNIDTVTVEETEINVSGLTMGQHWHVYTAPWDDAVPYDSPERNIKTILDYRISLERGTAADGTELYAGELFCSSLTLDEIKALVTEFKKTPSRLDTERFIDERKNKLSPSSFFYVVVKISYNELAVSSKMYIYDENVWRFRWDPPIGGVGLPDGYLSCNYTVKFTYLPEREFHVCAIVSTAGMIEENAVRYAADTISEYFDGMDWPNEITIGEYHE